VAHFPLTGFVAAMHRFPDEGGHDWVSFKPGQRKDDVALEYLANFDREEGILFIGVAQEKGLAWAPASGATRTRERCSRGSPRRTGCPTTSTCVASTTTSARS
jgi:hypothetical protein